MTFAIKQLPEDFVVEEIIDLPESKSGKYTYFSLKKKGLNSEEAIQKIAAYMKKPRRLFSYAGNKDRQAVTTQYCSFLGSMNDFSLQGIGVRIIGKGSEAVHLGRHSANKFVVTVRNLSSSDLEAFQKRLADMRQDNFKFVNYFDTQRFSRNNAEVGKEIIRKNFSGAAKLITGYNELQEYLKIHKNDFVGALKRLPQKTLQMYIHAYQSKLWNMLADKSGSKKNVKLPLVGFDTKPGKAVKQLLESEGISIRDFIVKQLPVSAEGHERELYASATDFKIVATGDDELNAGKSKITIAFSLPKASYATILIKELF
ncbi:MAG: tRNA pseudouridine(13) synthase TruD [Candidatus Woesearchaeota archaeon]